MDELYKNLSVRLYDIMEHIGASEEMRQLQQSTSIQQEITSTMVHYMEDRNISIYIFGSFMEGTTTPDLYPDIDTLNCHDIFPFHENTTDAPAGGAFLMVRDAHNQPGYVKLQLLWDGVPMTVYNSNLNEYVDSDCDGRSCLKHLYSGNCYERNGPADTSIHYYFPTDSVASCRCRSIPRFADKWTKQKRQFKWPSRQTLDSMTSSGCFVVGVGHPASDEKHIEWRISFSLQERYLMLSFNPTQHKCYILLKMVKNCIIGRTIGKCISSYHMKTCMFYTIQNTRQGIWIPANMFLCLSLCLNVLLKWVRCGYCPNYFIKEENMFDRDVHRQVKQPLSNLLDRLIKAGPRILLCIDCDNINQYLIHSERLPATLAAVERHREMLCTHSYVSEMYFRCSLLYCCMKKRELLSTCLFLNNSLEFVQKKSVLNRKPENYGRQTLSRIETYIQSQLGCSYVSLALTVGEPVVEHSLFNMADSYFQLGQYCDMTSSRLMYASIIYMAGQYDRCVRLLDEIDAELGHHVVSSCSCHVVNNVRDRIQCTSYVNTASCVIFLPSNTNITPAPLLPEMYRSVGTSPGSRHVESDCWFDCAAVDGKVYLYFLKYLAYGKLDQHVHKHVAVDNIKWLIDNELNLGHRETAFNLLGWIYVEENRIVHGIRCFKKSWIIRPIHNAAKWHLGIAIYKHIVQA